MQVPINCAVDSFITLGLIVPRQVDVVLNIFAKPYQTALALLSLLKFSGQYVDCIYLQFEPSGSRYDAVPPYAITGYLQENGYKLDIFQPDIWLECDPVDESSLDKPAYRMAVRYQYAFEKTDKKYLFFMHNDVLIKRDIIGAMLEQAGDAFAIGQIGQCWNCPASKPDLTEAANLGAACTPERYLEFRPTFAQLSSLYDEARVHKVFVRPYWEGWDAQYSWQSWPLPECRVNEWGCMVDIEQTRPLTIPQGKILPFGAFEHCGSVTLDTAVAWFRELSRLGMKARHFPLDKYLTHFVGNHRITRELHMQAELNAQELLLRSFPDFASWFRAKRNKLF